MAFSASAILFVSLFSLTDAISCNKPYFGGTSRSFVSVPFFSNGMMV
jgi:hypothetical protein